MRGFVIFSMMVWGGAAAAHTGHWGELAGHDHWLAGAAIGIAVIIGLAGAAKGRKKDDDPDAAEAEENEEAAA